MITAELWNQRTPTSGVHAALDAERARARAVLGDRYDVLELIGHGGMSRVYRGCERRTGRPVAIKMLASRYSAALADRERFHREARIAATMRHPNIVSCLEFVRTGRTVVAVMEFVDGPTLAQRLEAVGALSPEVVLGLLVPLAAALEHLHDNRVVHLDIKPGNILLRTADGAPFLTDFGIALLRTSEQSRAEVSRRFGTPEFMSPEQSTGWWDADHRSDIYSLGLVAYRALTGRLPYAGGSPVAHVAQRTCFDAPPVGRFAPHVPAGLARVIDRCVARDPRRRWSDAGALRQALLAVDPAGRPVSATWRGRLDALRRRIG